MVRRAKFYQSLGLSEKEPFYNILIALLAIMGVGMIADLLATVFGLWLGVLLIISAYVLYKFVNHRSKNLKFKPQSVEKTKTHLISILPSSEELYIKIIKPYSNLERIYLIKDKNSKDSWLQKDSKQSLRMVKTIANPVNVISACEEILEELKAEEIDFENVVIDTTSGVALSSIALYEVGRLKKIDTTYLKSDYDRDGNRVEDSGQITKIDFTSE
ncbi:MAG: hypothetical protein ACOC08_05315 [Campylobacterales bacterium]